MPAGVVGTTITLFAQYQDGTGAAVNPGTPLVSIFDPFGEEVAGPDTPTFEGSTGRYSYDFPIPVDAPLSDEWSAVWSGVINGTGVESTEMFTVAEAGGIQFGLDCQTLIWATVAELIELHADIDEDSAMEVLAEATWLLSGLVNDRYHHAQCWTDDYQYRKGLCRIELAHQPVAHVFSITRFDPDTGEEVAIDGWKNMAGGSVRICCRDTNSMWLRHSPIEEASPCTSCDDKTVRVRYRTLDNLPPGTSRQVLKLAWEFWKSSQGKSCALPERVTNVTREGVAWTILDPLDFLDKGLTGIGSVDQWISRVNMKGWAGMIDPLTRPRLLFSELTGCGESCTGTEF